MCFGQAGSPAKDQLYPININICKLLKYLGDQYIFFKCSGRQGCQSFTGNIQNQVTFMRCNRSHISPFDYLPLTCG